MSRVIDDLIERLETNPTNQEFADVLKVTRIVSEQGIDALDKAFPPTGPPPGGGAAPGPPPRRPARKEDDEDEDREDEEDGDDEDEDEDEDEEEAPPRRNGNGGKAAALREVMSKMGKSMRQEIREEVRRALGKSAADDDDDELDAEADAEEYQGYAPADDDDEVEVPQPGEVQKAIYNAPGGQEAFDTYPVLAQVCASTDAHAEVLGELAKAVNQNSADIRELVKILRPVAKSLKKSLPTEPDPEETPESETPEADQALKSLVDGAVKGLRELQAQVQSQQEVLDKRPYSPHTLQKGTGRGNRVLSKSMAIQIIQKGVREEKINQVQGQHALEALDTAQRYGETFEDVIRELTPGLFSDVAALNGSSE